MHGREGKTLDFICKQTITWPSTRKMITGDSSTAAIACLSIIDGILATAASLEARGIPSIPMVVLISRSSITVVCDFETVRTPPVSTTMNSWSPQYDRPYKRSLVTPGSSTTIALFPYKKETTIVRNHFHHSDFKSRNFQKLISPKQDRINKKKNKAIKKHWIPQRDD